MARRTLQRTVGFLLTAAVCASAQAGELPRLEEVLLRVRNAIGAPMDLDQIHTLHAAANCKGPAGPYLTEITSTRDGRVWFRQQRPPGPAVEIAVLGTRGWLMAESRATDRLDGKAVATVLGHEFQAAQLWLTERLQGLTVAGRGTLQGREAFVLAGRDRFENPVRAFVDVRGFRLLGLEWTNPDEPNQPVLILFESWTRVARVWLVSRVTVVQGAQSFRFDFRNIRVNEVPEERLRAWERANSSASGNTDGVAPPADSNQ